MDLTLELQLVLLVISIIPTYFISKYLLQQAIDAIGMILVEIFQKPATKQAMSIIGSKSGQVRHDRRIMDKAATQFLNSPKLQGLKMGAKHLLGIDIDQMIAEEGPVETIQGLKGIADMLGIDIMQFSLGDSLALPKGSGGSGKNPYM